MKSPAFQLRAQRLRVIFTADRLKSAWKGVVRVSARRSQMRDIIEHFDLHLDQDRQFAKLINSIFEGRYTPAPPARVLVEKSKGLCRQLVMPSISDMVVLQVLSASLYAELKGKAPTKKAFFEPEEHAFSATGDKLDYGGFAAWKKFQKTLLKFAEEREFVVVTDIANYYDSISYVHLRNVLSALSGEAECVLDMLIFILSGLLWQPDYMPRVEIGLPQIDIDAPRYLAHCFLFELDRHLAAKEDVDFVRFMDDIDIGVDTVSRAKTILKEIDLLLQTRQVRLNSGKTQILTKAEAEVHFCIEQNAELDELTEKLESKSDSKEDIKAEREVLQAMWIKGLKNRVFDKGNGEKILKRILGLCTRYRVALKTDEVAREFRRRPQCRDAVLRYFVAQGPLLADHLDHISSLLNSGLVVDQATYTSVANCVVEGSVAAGKKVDVSLAKLVESFPEDDLFGVYSRLILLSKYGSPIALRRQIEQGRAFWWQDYRLARLVGGLLPCFQNSQDEAARFIDLIKESRSHGATETFDFHERLEMDPSVFKQMRPFLKSPNTSKPTGITHAKFMCLISALRCSEVDFDQRKQLVAAQKKALADRHYLALYRRALGPEANELLKPMDLKKKKSGKNG